MGRKGQQLQVDAQLEQRWDIGKIHVSLDLQFINLRENTQGSIVRCLKLCFKDIYLYFVREANSFSTSLAGITFTLIYCIKSRMQMIGRINSMMEKGWKMTDVYCPNCNGTTMAEPKAQIDTLYCPKEDKTFPYDLERQDPEPQEHQRSKSSEEDDYFQSVVQQMKKEKVQNPPINNRPAYRPQDFDMIELNEKDIHALNRTNDVSKKIGEKLLQGWTMLNQSCNNCYAPIMRSKTGQKVCFGCESAEKKPAELKALPPTVLKPVAEYQKFEPQRQKLMVKSQPVKAKELKKESQKKQQIKKEEAVKQVKKPQEKKEEKEQEQGQRQKQEEEGEPQMQEEEKPNQNKSEISKAIARIEKKTLEFLQTRLLKAFEFGNIEEIQKSLQLVYKIKREFK